MIEAIKRRAEEKKAEGGRMAVEIVLLRGNATRRAA
jgi:hypothetical protein